MAAQVDFMSLHHFNNSGLSIERNQTTDGQLKIWNYMRTLILLLKIYPIGTIIFGPRISCKSSVGSLHLEILTFLSKIFYVLFFKNV